MCKMEKGTSLYLVVMLKPVKRRGTRGEKTYNDEHIFLPLTL